MGGIYWSKREEIRNLWKLPLDKLELYQEERLKTFLLFCKENSNFYKNKIPSHFNDAYSVLAKVLPVNKTDIVRSFDDIRTLSPREGITSLREEQPVLH